MKRLHRAGTMMAMLAVSVVSGCAVVSVATTAGSLAVGAVSTAADVAIGAGRVATRVVGAGIDAVTPAPAAAVAKK